MRLERNKIFKAVRQIKKEFPQFERVKPVISEQVMKPQTLLYRKLSMGLPRAVKKITRLKFKKKVHTRDHQELENILIVTLDEEGRIIKRSMTK